MAIRPQCTRIVMTHKKESSYGTAVGYSDIDKRFNLREPVLVVPEKQKVDDMARLKGHEFPTDPTNNDIIVARNLQIPFSFDASLELLGILFASAMGQDSVTRRPASGDLLYYEHELKALDICVTDQYPSVSWIIGHQGTEESIMLAKGVIVNDLRLALEGKGWISVSGTAYGDGTYTVVPGSANYAIPTTEFPDDYIVGVNASFLSADQGGALVSKAAKLRGMELTINNNLDTEDAHGNIIAAGVNLGSLRTGDRSYTLSVTMEGHQGDEFWSDYDNDTEKTVEVTITKNANRSFKMSIPRCKVETITFGFDGIRSTVTVEYKMFYDTTEMSPVVFTIRNGDAGYLG